MAVVAFLLCCTIIGYLPAAIWSYLVAAEHYADARNDKLIRAVRGSQGGRRNDDPPSDNPFAF